MPDKNKRPVSNIALTIDKGAITAITIDGTIHIPASPLSGQNPSYQAVGKNQYERDLDISVPNQLSLSRLISTDNFNAHQVTQQVNNVILAERKAFHIVATGTTVSGEKLEGEISYEKMCQLLETNEAVQTLKQQPVVDMDAHRYSHRRDPMAMPYMSANPLPIGLLTLFKDEAIQPANQPKPAKPVRAR